MIKQTVQKLKTIKILLLQSKNIVAIYFNNLHTIQS